MAASHVFDFYFWFLITKGSGKRFDPTFSHPRFEEINANQCHMFGWVFSAEQWNRRPPKKEQPTTPDLKSEVAWLRSLVENMDREEMKHKYRGWHSMTGWDGYAALCGKSTSKTYLRWRWSQVQCKSCLKRRNKNG